MLVIFIALQIRIFTIKEDNIYNKSIKDDMTSGNYDNAQNIVKQTINKNYADLSNILFKWYDYGYYQF